MLFITVLAIGGIAAEPAAPGTNPPNIHGETLNGNSIDLPQAAAGKVTVLILGFSKQGGQQTGIWEKHLSQDFSGDAHFTSYTVAVLEDAPALFRKMIKAGIRSGTPTPKRDYVITTESGEASLKRFLGVSDNNIPYLLLLDGTGRVCWSGQGTFEEHQYEALRTAIKDREAEAKPLQRQ